MPEVPPVQTAHRLTGWKRKLQNRHAPAGLADAVHFTERLIGVRHVSQSKRDRDDLEMVVREREGRGIGFLKFQVPLPAEFTLLAPSNCQHFRAEVGSYDRN